MAKISVTINSPEWDTVIRYTDHDGKQVQQSIYGEGDTPTALARRAMEMRCNIAQVTTIRGAAEQSTYGHDYGHALLEIPSMFARYSEGWQEGWGTLIAGEFHDGYGGIVQIIRAETGEVVQTMYGMPEKYRPRDRAAA
jgi:hypothetical protein